MNLFKKKEVPEELPGLAIDEITHKINAPQIPLEEKKQENLFKPLPKQSISQTPNQTQNLVLPKDIQKEEIKPLVANNPDEKGFFRDIIKTVTEESDNLDKLDSWYKKEFMGGDLVYQMREYWEKQNPEVILKSISGDLKNKLLEKTESLHRLEKEWQEIYFDMLTKEEEIRKEEKELKTLLSDFIAVFKNSANKNKKQGR